VRIEGFPRLPRLKVLYLNNNRVSKVARNLQGELLLHGGGGVAVAAAISVAMAAAAAER